MSNQYEMYNQVLNLINYFKPCKILVEVYLPGLAVSGVCVFWLQRSYDSLYWL